MTFTRYPFIKKEKDHMVQCNVTIPPAFLFHLHLKAKVVGILFFLIGKIKASIPKLFQYFGKLNRERFFSWWKDHITPWKSGFMMAFSNSTMHGASVILFDPQKKNSFSYIMDSLTEFSFFCRLAHILFYTYPCQSLWYNSAKSTLWWMLINSNT